MLIEPNSHKTPGASLRAKIILIISLVLIGGGIFLITSSFKNDKVNQAATLPKEMQWTIENTVRKALVYIPETAKSKPTPVIFAFHGHGGTMENAYRSHGFDKLWPEAIFICPQGLKTPGKLTDPEGKKNGWLLEAVNGKNRDLEFFDAMLSTIKKDYNVDAKRIYITGHSNGGGFTYALWAQRGETFAAVAPTSSSGGRFMKGVKPKPFFLAMGEKDPLVKPEWQKLTFNVVSKLNKCSADGQKIDQFTTLYKSASGNDAMLLSHPGGHEYIQDANAVMIKFFKDHPAR